MCSDNYDVITKNIPPISAYKVTFHWLVPTESAYGYRGLKK